MEGSGEMGKLLRLQYMPLRRWRMGWSGAGTVKNSVMVLRFALGYSDSLIRNCYGFLLLDSVFGRGWSLARNRAPGNGYRGSLHCAPPDFLWRPVALMICMWLSLRRAAHVDVASNAK